MKSLVGYTGFVGSNLLEQTDFEGLYNSKNIENAYGTCPELLIYAGVPGTKYLANKYCIEDKQIINSAIYNIKNIMPQKLVLISTVDVYSSLNGCTEDSKIDDTKLSPYGKHRYMLEEWVKSNIRDYHIIRLPAIYGDKIKKNFIYDLINRTPSMISIDRYKRIEKQVKNYYEPYNKEFMKLRYIGKEERKELESFFRNSEYSSLMYTDSRAYYQFYNLKYLYDDILKVISHQIPIINLVTEPINAGDLYWYLYHDIFTNYISSDYIQYRLKTNYDTLWNTKNGYIKSASEIYMDIQHYIETNRCYC